MKTPEQRHWHRSGVFIVNFENNSHLALVFLLLTLSKKLPTGSSFTPQWTNLLSINKNKDAKKLRTYEA